MRVAGDGSTVYCGSTELALVFDPMIHGYLHVTAEVRCDGKGLCAEPTAGNGTLYCEATELEIDFDEAADGYVHIPECSCSDDSSEPCGARRHDCICGLDTDPLCRLHGVEDVRSGGYDAAEQVRAYVLRNLR